MGRLPKSAYQKCGAIIAKIRKDKNLTQDQLAQEIGIDRTTLVNIEVGRYRPSILHLQDLSVALEVSVNEFFKDIIP